MTFEEYLDIRNSYIDRNLFLYLFEISAPRGFGDTWALGHLTEIVPEFKRPNKKLDPTYRGEYDLYLDWIDDKGKNNYIKIEVKASRAVDREKPDEPLYVKALAADSKQPFLMNFQQIKPRCCDVFIWIAVYRDKIKYWAINSNRIQVHEDFVPQHRNEGTATRSKNFKKDDIYEGQVMVTKDNIGKFGDFICNSAHLKTKVIQQYKIQNI
ncbi:MAG: hypothetical protein HYY63_06460 [Elusimicrobia bacterium]|nr:hypothetical protein [Elusimicrobiota bacterium]